MTVDLHWFDFYDPAREPFVRRTAEIWGACLPETGGEAAFVMDYDREIAKGRPPGHVVQHDLAAVVDGMPVGAAVLVQRTADNVDEGTVNVVVEPAHRRKGVATTLLTEVTRKAHELGMTRLSSWVVTAAGREPLGELFAAAAGFHEADPYRESALRLPIDAERLAALDADADGGAAGYTVETCVGTPTADWFEPLALMRRRMSTDAPHSVDREEAVITAETIAEQFARDERAGTVRVTALARDAAGEPVAFSELDVTPGDDDAQQGETLVLREHRGHRLGLATKLATLAVLAERYPQATRITTGNHRDNAPMLAVNDKLGFEEFARSGNWIRAL